MVALAERIGQKPLATAHTYAYDALGRRVSKTVGEVTTTFINNAEWQEIAEYQGANLVQSYVYGFYIDEVLCMVKANGDRYWYSTNDLYSVYALTDSTGAVVERYMYDPYGAVTICNPNGSEKTGEARVCSAFGNPFFFTGRRNDDETRWFDASKPAGKEWQQGLMQYRTRYHDTNLGQFLNRNPWKYVQSRWSLYDFCAQRPSFLVEPFSKTGAVAAKSTSSEPPHHTAYRQATGVGPKPELLPPNAPKSEQYKRVKEIEEWMKNYYKWQFAQAPAAPSGSGAQGDCPCPSGIWNGKGKLSNIMFVIGRVWATGTYECEGTPSVRCEVKGRDASTAFGAEFVLGRSINLKTIRGPKCCKDLVGRQMYSYSGASASVGPIQFWIDEENDKLGVSAEGGGDIPGSKVGVGGSIGVRQGEGLSLTGQVLPNSNTNFTVEGGDIMEMELNLELAFAFGRTMFFNVEESRCSK